MPLLIMTPSSDPTEYLSKTIPIIQAVVEANPNYKQLVGSRIYTFVVGLAGA